MSVQEQDTRTQHMTDEALAEQIVDWREHQAVLLIRSKSQLAQPDAYDRTMYELDEVEDRVDTALAELRRRRHARIEYREFAEQRSAVRW